MKRNIILITAWAGLILVLQPLLTVGQTFSGAAGTERLAGYADRTLYIAGETIRFAVFSTAPRGPLSNDPDRIFYAELVTPAGKRLAAGKFLLGTSAGSGCLEIPGSALTGNCFVKCYTGAMRNDGPEHYLFLPVKVINPENAALEPGAATSFQDFTHREMPDPDTGYVRIDLEPDQSYHPGSRISIKIVPPDSLDEPLPVFITVAPLPASAELQPFHYASAIAAEQTWVYPESDGVVLSGRMTLKSGGSLPTPARVNLSVLGEKDHFSARCDSAGRFFFSLPAYEGTRDLFISADDTLSGLEIRVDNDFCSRPFRLKAPPFALTEEEGQVALQMAVNQSLAQRFEQDPAGQVTPDTMAKPFFGIPTEVIDMDRYIELSTLEEYFSELSESVKLKAAKGRMEFRFTLREGPASEGEPLVLVDWVAVPDIRKVLAMPPSEVRRIELVSVPYLKGDREYSGIICFITRKGDFGGIDLPSSGLFLPYGFLSKCQGTDMEPSQGPDEPDARNTVMAKMVSVETGTRQPLTAFTAPGTPGKYLIRVRGVKPDGRPFCSAREVELKLKP